MVKVHNTRSVMSHTAVPLCVFRQGLLHLVELCQHPIIVITLEGQSKRMKPEIKQQLSEQQHRLTVLTWRHNSVVRSAVSEPEQTSG